MMKKKKTMLFLLLACLPAGVLFSQVNNDERKAGFQLSFVPPLSTQGTLAPEYTNAVSFNILAGVSKNVTAFSISGLGVYATNSLQGFHLSGLGSYAKGDGNGMMISGLLNHTKAYSGFQLAGLMNVAEDVNGFQFAGLVNKARNVKGVQFAGLINIADNSDYPIGLINLIRNGEKSVGVTYDEIGSTIVGFRSGGRIMYGILGMGYNHKAKEEKYVMEGGFGAHIPLSSRFRINAELRSQFLTDFSEDNQINHNTFAIMPAFRITPHFEIFGGPSINFMYTENINNKNMFPGGHIWKKFTEAELKQLYIGFSAGVQYIF